LGHQKVEHGPQGGGTKRKIQIAELEEWRERLTTLPSYIKKESKDGRQANQDQAIQAGR
jgi:hypothetical protein